MDIITLAAAKAAAKQYTDAQIATINSVGFHICTSAEYDSSTGLPIIQNPDEATFYLVPSGDSGNNIFDEYFYTNNQWELFGSGYLDVSLPENFAAEYDSTATYAVGSYAMHDGVLYKCTTAIASAEAWTAAHWTATSVGNELGGYVKNTDYATYEKAGIIKTAASYGIDINPTTHAVFITPATLDEMKAGQAGYKPITTVREHAATFYGLAKAAGDATQSASENAVGTYTDDAKAAIRTMLGAVGKTDYATTTDAGVVSVNGYGLEMSSGRIRLVPATDAGIKSANSSYGAVVPTKQHQSVFYGLATAAGDSTQASSDNAVGTYTAAAKSAIQTMLGVDGCAMVEVSGATPEITGQANTRYICGTVTSISITPPSSGIIDVIFTSGSTAATLTLPSTVKMPDWFGGVEPNTVYEINIAEGVYGSVMTWEA